MGSKRWAFKNRQGSPFVAVTFPGIGEVTLHAGDRLWIRGPNGSGKTSLLRCLAGLEAPMGTAGPPGANLAFQDARDNFIGLTVDGERRLRNLPEVGDRRETNALSTGEATRIGHQLTHGDLWLLDEPAESLDADALQRLREQIQAANAVAFVDHTGQLADLATRTIDLGETNYSIPEIRNESRPLLQVGHLRSTSAFSVITGPNGCGKSTLLRAFAKENDCIYLPPRAKDLLLEPTASAWIDPPPRHPLQWSGGEQQRLALAHTFAKQADLYVLDEPEKHLDAAGLALLIEAIQTVIDRGGRVVAASHSLQGETLCF